MEAQSILEVSSPCSKRVKKQTCIALMMEQEHGFPRVFIQPFLDACYVLGSLPSAGDSAVSKPNVIPTTQSSHSLQEKGCGARTTNVTSVASVLQSPVTLNGRYIKLLAQGRYWIRDLGNEQTGEGRRGGEKEHPSALCVEQLIPDTHISLSSFASASSLLYSLPVPLRACTAHWIFFLSFKLLSFKNT